MTQIIAIVKSCSVSCFYYFRRVYTMWFLLYLVHRHDLFTFQKFRTCVDDTFLVHNESHNNRNLFVDWWVARFISLIFLSTSVALNILLSLYQLFCDFENFISLFDRFRFWVPTRFPEVIRPRYDPDWPNLEQYIAKKFFLQHY